MLRYVNTGKRRYHRLPVRPYARGVVEFQAVLSGHACPYPDERGAEVGPGPYLWVHPAYSVHGWTDDPGGVSRVAVFHFEEKRDLFSEMLAQRGRIRVPLTGPEAADLEKMARRTLREYGATLKVESGLWFAHVRAKLAWMASRGAGGALEEGVRPRAVWTVEDALRCYRERVMDNPGVGEVAEEVGVSPSHLRRLFHQVQSCSPRSLFRRIRLETARVQVRDTTRSVEEIAATLGFSEPAAFSRAYRQVFGVSPGRDRRKTFTPEAPRA